MFERRMFDSQGLLKGMVWTGVGVSLAVVLLRVWLLPVTADWQTGLFTSNYWVIGLMLGALVALLIMNYLAGPVRREVGGSAAVSMALGSLLLGITMAAAGALDLLRLFGILNGGNAANGTGIVLPALEYGFCLLGGAALIRLGLALLSEGATRRGIAQWSILAPVLWAWFRLIGYEMSYASMVRIEDNFFGVVMLIVEMLFLFRLARFTSGIGRVGASSLMFHAMATVMFAVSGPLTRVGMYLLQDNMAYSAYSLAGPMDMAIGVFALIVGVALLSGEEIVQSVVEPEEGPVDSVTGDVSATTAAGELLLEEIEEEE